jgi:alkylated DNA repair dioxygenase AlkB
MANVRSQTPANLPTDVPVVAWQASLLAGGAAPPAVDPRFVRLRRVELSRGAWVDHVPTWLTGADELFAAVVAGAPWHQRTVTMHGRIVDEPRLHAWYGTEPHAAVVPPVLGDAADALSARYHRAFTHLGAALYRDGRDSVAWHGDRIPREVVEPIVAILSLGGPRTLRLRPKGGGASRPFELHSGDLLVMGGTSQRTWEHSVPKTAHAPPRISIQFRHDL